MEFNLKEGIVSSMETVVTKNDTASKYGSGDLDVFATPALVAFIENTAKDSVGPYLPCGYTTVGTEVNIKHIKATTIGKKVTCNTVLIKIEGKKLIFKVEAWDESAKIGEGTHTRYMVNNEKFMEKARS